MASGASPGCDPFGGGGLPGGQAGRRLSLPRRGTMSEQAPIQPLTREKQERKRKQSMHHPALETIAGRLLGHLRCEQEDLCRPIVQQVTRGKPVAPAALRASLQVSQDELEQRLAKLPPDVEFDRAGNIVGLGVTLVPTSHRIQLGGQVLYTWCAFDTVLLPPQLDVEAQVQSTCPVTGQPIIFVATPEGVIRDL